MNHLLTRLIPRRRNKRWIYGSALVVATALLAVRPVIGLFAICVILLIRVAEVRARERRREEYSAYEDYFFETPDRKR